MLDAKRFEEIFQQGLGYEAYVKTGKPEQQRRWNQVYELASLRPEDRQRIGTFSRQAHVLAISGIWCGDCAQQCPLIARIAEGAAGTIDYRLIDRDAHADFSSHFHVNGGGRVPILIFLAEDFEFCGLMGDRTLQRYRTMARKYLGPACPTGILPPDQDELAAGLTDWLDEIERIQWMLRLSPRLREKHGD